MVGVKLVGVGDGGIVVGIHRSSWSVPLGYIQTGGINRDTL